MFAFFILFLVVIPTGADGNLCWSTTEEHGTKELPGGNILLLAELDWNKTDVKLDLIESDREDRELASLIKHETDGFFVLSWQGNDKRYRCNIYQQILLNRTDGEWSSRYPNSDGDEFSNTCSRFNASGANEIRWSNIKRLTLCQQPFSRIISLITNGDSIATCIAEGIPPLTMTINGRTTTHNKSIAEVPQEIEENVSTVTCSVKSTQLQELKSSNTVGLGCVKKVTKSQRSWIYLKAHKFSFKENILSIGIKWRNEPVLVRFYFYDDYDARSDIVVEIHVPKEEEDVPEAKLSAASLSSTLSASINVTGFDVFQMKISETSTYIQLTCLSSMLYIATSANHVRHFAMKNFCSSKSIEASSTKIETQHCRKDSFNSKIQEIPSFVGDTFQLKCSTFPKIPFQNTTLRHKDQPIAVSENGTVGAEIEYKEGSSGRYTCESCHPLLGCLTKDTTMLTIPGTITPLPSQELAVGKKVSWTIKGYPIYNHIIKCPGLPDGYFSREIEAVNRTRIDVTIPTDYDTATCSTTFDATLGKTSKPGNPFQVTTMVLIGVALIIITGIACGVVIMYKKRNKTTPPPPAILVSRVSTLPREEEEEMGEMSVQNGYQIGNIYDSTSEWQSTQGHESSCSFGGESTGCEPWEEGEPDYSEIDKRQEAVPVYSTVDKSEDAVPVYSTVDKSEDVGPLNSTVDRSQEPGPVYSTVDKSQEAGPVYSTVDKSKAEEPCYSDLVVEKPLEPEPVYSIVDKNQDGDAEYASLEFFNTTPDSQNEEEEHGEGVYESLKRLF